MSKQKVPGVLESVLLIAGAVLIIIIVLTLFLGVREPEPVVDDWRDGHWQCTEFEVIDWELSESVFYDEEHNLQDWVCLGKITRVCAAAGLNVMSGESVCHGYFAGVHCDVAKKPIKECKLGAWVWAKNAEAEE